MNNPLDARRVFGDVVAGQLHRMASDYEHLAQRLRVLAERVPAIGSNATAIKHAAARDLTACDIAIEAVTEVQRHTPGLRGLLRAAADYDRDVPGFLKEDR